MNEPRSAGLARAETDVALARERVVRSVEALRLEIGRRVDWHDWFGRRPGTFLVTAFAVGFLFGQRR
jgi:hypothetical protein